MKKIYLIACIAFCFNTNAQYTKLLDFAGATNGGNPYGSLMQAGDDMLYGMTENGGANSMGVLFQYNPTTNTYTKKFDFSTTNGNYPNGDLMQASDGMLYGMTPNGGANDSGVIFQYNPTTSTYVKKFDFSTTSGSNPYGSLMQASNGMLYGMTSSGGANGWGVLFQYNSATNTYIKKLDFAGTTNGGNPKGSLMQASDGMLYGMTENGGANNDGLLFQYNPTTNTYMDKYDFANTATSGSKPYGSLIQASDGMLYGMTYRGGANGWGVIFKYNPTTNTYTDTYDFANTATSGSNLSGDLMQASDGMLYGMAYGGGANSDGLLFQYNLTTNTYTDKYDFASATGRSPDGSLIQASDGCLYGMTNGGGANNLGVLFKYCIGTTGIQQLAGNNEQVNIYPNPNNGSFVIEPSSNTKQTLLVYDVNGKQVLSQTINGKTSIDASNLNEGVYNINIISNEGVINKRLVIVK